MDKGVGDGFEQVGFGFQRGRGGIPQRPDTKRLQAGRSLNHKGKIFVGGCPAR